MTLSDDQNIPFALYDLARAYAAVRCANYSVFDHPVQIASARVAVYFYHLLNPIVSLITHY